MHIHWRALFGFGLIFWLLLCLNESLGGGKLRKYGQVTDLDDIYDKKFVENLAVKKPDNTVQNLQQRGIKFGLSLLLWNTVAFVFSIVFCSLARTLSWVLWKVQTYYKHGQQSSAIRANLAERNISRIPVIIKSHSTIARSSDTNIGVADSSHSAPMALKRSSSSISQSAVTKNCQTLFKNDHLVLHKACRFDRQVDIQCARLREEMIKMQANSLKEHATLTKRLDAVNREKRELSKLLTVAQKENRAAKQQLDELLQEKTILIRRLDNASKEFKCNTKTKKFALAKLEEATAEVDDLKQQLEQVTRDKEILESKLRVLECEYEKLQERLILNQGHENFYHEHTPERDTNGKEREQAQNTSGNQACEMEASAKNCSNISTVSQTELDMKKIELKIKQLERNLENFNATKSELNFPTADREESDLSLSVRGNLTDSMVKTDEEGDISENPFLSSPRFRYWGGRAGDLIGRKDQFAKIQALATKMHEKVRFLENIKERCESTQGTDVEDLSSPESLDDDRQPKRIVSSSAAFQNFLRSLHSSESMKRQFGSHSDLFF